jgi:NAD(P)H-dependent FMN reductase
MDAFKGKWIGLVANQGSPSADMVAFTHLRQVVNTVYGYTLQTQVKSNKHQYSESPSGYVLEDQEVLARCVRLVDEIFKVTE